ncbi:hypothetical protein [Demequina iriomotensis]|uniref:hypothetical protein n=1 Tax=Demequina iriomotensis TaxID=1536641 RepID=UPI0007819F15|nr:hypothetical protein [Demequina iriomotensis]
MTENDPFLSNPGAQPPAEQPKYHPASGLNPGQSHAPAPGVIPGAAAPSPAYGTGPQVPFGQDGVPLEKPKGLATGLLAVTGANAVIGLIVATTASDAADAIIEILETGTTTTSVGSPLGNLSLPLTLAAYVLYGLWMTRMRRNREAMGARPGLPGVEWWGWFVPFAGLILLPLGARKVVGRTTSLALLLGWWLTYLASYAAGLVGAAAIFGVFDWETGEVVNTAALDSYPASAWASAALMLVSWGFLFGFVRQATERHVDPQA